MAEQRSKRSKRPDRRPARGRYWVSGRLGKHKVSNLMRHNGFKTEAEARVFWLNARKRFYGLNYKPRSK